MDSRQVLPPHPISPEAKKYLATLTVAEMELHKLAVERLGSSYFVERTHAYRKWKASQAAGAK
jgi:hypothetical protein